MSLVLSELLPTTSEYTSALTNTTGGLQARKRRKSGEVFGLAKSSKLGNRRSLESWTWT